MCRGCPPPADARSQCSFHACPVRLSAPRQRTFGTPSSSSAAVPSALPAPVRGGLRSLWEAGAGIPVVDKDGRGQNITKSMENTAPVQAHTLNTRVALPEPYIIRVHSTRCFVTWCTLLGAFLLSAFLLVSVPSYSGLSNSTPSYSASMPSYSMLPNSALSYSVSVPSFSVLSNSTHSYSMSMPSYSVLSNSTPSYSVSMPSYSVLSDSVPSYSVSVPSYSVLSNSALSYSVSVPSY